MSSEGNDLIADRADRALAADTSLPELFLEQAQAHPAAIAVAYEAERLTYAELERRSSQLAVYLQHVGVTPDEGVGVFVEASIDLMVSAWGVLFAGGAYLPLSPEYPEDRLRYMIADARIRVIVSHRELAHRLEELAPPGTRIVTPQDAAEFARTHGGAGGRAIATHPRPSDLAYIVYTSGSSGKPKGVMIEHRSIVNQMHWLKTVYGLDRHTVVLQKTPISFDAAQWEILSPTCGSKVVIASPGAYRDPERLIHTIVQHSVTTLQCVPTLLQALLDTEQLHTCNSLTRIFCGGEVLARRLALRCLAALPECGLVNLYGPTECTINATALSVDRRAAANGPETISIGSPVDNTRCYVLDDELSPVAAGVVGELYIGGVQVARGYLHRPDLTASRFIADPFHATRGAARLYRTGDLASRSADGTLQFVGRKDNQVKLRGYRIELDEIRLAIEAHDWVRHAEVILKRSPRTGFENLVAFVEMNPKEAALMDQGNHGAHHQSKESRLQLKAQLSNAGCRGSSELDGKEVVDLPGRVPTPAQRRLVFARKTYRFFEGGGVSKADILGLLGGRIADQESPTTGQGSRSLGSLGLADLGEILRYFGQYRSKERLLPKYGYASPGALYATQMYCEIAHVGGLRPGYYYYHPVDHRLVLIRPTVEPAREQVTIHFVGKRRAIEPVYMHNVQEVLEIETGHMVGLFEGILPRYGLAIAERELATATMANVECAEEDPYLGTFEIVPYGTTRRTDQHEIFVQSHPGRIADLPAGLYEYADGELTRISDDLVLQRHVIAINQQVYRRASFGITIVSKAREGWMGYIDLGRMLQRLQMNDLGLGLMSAGYSSKSGNALPAARRIERTLAACGRQPGPSYFFVGGRVSDEQVRGEGMKEDAVHMKGPAEMIKDDLVTYLPDYMMPNRVIVLDRMPLTANGKIDAKALAALDTIDTDLVDRPPVLPRTETEAKIHEIWKQEMKRDDVSVHDDFFESGGNSLLAVSLINKINRVCRSALPLQGVFEGPTIEALARRVEDESAEPASRLVRLQPGGPSRPVYCWPGLGGYAMNLRLLATRLGDDRPFYGVQAHGINENEIPYQTIREMATADIDEIKQLQPTGPYTLWGYSFGARVAFETAYQLEQAGDRVDHLFLIAPGSPAIRVRHAADCDLVTYRNTKFVTILLSVFTGSIAGPVLDDCLKSVSDEESFASFISSRFETLDRDLVKRVMRIVYQTYSFRYEFHELAKRQLSTPITIFKARGDDYAFIESAGSYSVQTPTIINLHADHYSMLKETGVDELVRMIRFRLGGSGDTEEAAPRGRRLRVAQAGSLVDATWDPDDRRTTKGAIVPHVHIKHFPVSLSDEQEDELITAITSAVSSAFRCDGGVVSIALEPVRQEAWNDEVYGPEIMQRKDILRKQPNY